MPAISTSPGQRLRAERERLGLSQVEAAERAGMDQPLWSKYERGKNPLSLDMILRLAYAIGADPHAIDPRLASVIARR